MTDTCDTINQRNRLIIVEQAVIKIRLLFSYTKRQDIL